MVYERLTVAEFVRAYHSDVDFADHKNWCMRDNDDIVSDYLKIFFDNDGIVLIDLDHTQKIRAQFIDALDDFMHEMHDDHQERLIEYGC